MTAIDTIRVITADPKLYSSDVIITDGVSKSIQTKYYPLVSGSETVPAGLGAYTVADENSGLLTFTTAPPAPTATISYFHVLLLDAQIQALIDLETETSSDTDLDLRLPAADCLDAIASSQALILKKIKLLDLDTDGASVAKALRDHAAMLRKQSYDLSMQESAFDITEQVYDAASWKEKIIKDWFRQFT